MVVAVWPDYFPKTSLFSAYFPSPISLPFLFYMTLLITLKETSFILYFYFWFKHLEVIYGVYSSGAWLTKISIPEIHYDIRLLGNVRKYKIGYRHSLGKSSQNPEITQGWKSGRR